jgi:hypothetical protein
MSDDGSIAATRTISFGKLLDRVERKLDPADVLELVRRGRQALAQPDRRVGAALTPKHRGGDQDADQRAERDRALRELTELQPGTKPNARIIAARRKLLRYEAIGWPRERDKPEETGNRERDLMRTIMGTGLPVPGERQHRAIMAGRPRK